MLDFCSVMNYIYRLTDSVAVTAFSRCDMVGASWTILDLAIFNGHTFSGILYLIAILDYISYYILSPSLDFAKENTNTLP